MKHVRVIALVSLCLFVDQSTSAARYRHILAPDFVLHIAVFLDHMKCDLVLVIAILAVVRCLSLRNVIADCSELRRGQHANGLVFCSCFVPHSTDPSSNEDCEADKQIVKCLHQRVRPWMTLNTLSYFKVSKFTSKIIY